MKWYENITKEQMYAILQILASTEDDPKKNLIRLLVSLLELQDAYIEDRSGAPVTAAEGSFTREDFLERFKHNLEEGATQAVPFAVYTRKVRRE